MKEAIELLEKFSAFREIEPEGDMARFGRWLQSGTSDPGEELTHEPAVNRESRAVRAAFLLGSLTAFVENWLRLSYRDVPVVSLGDFGILKTVEKHGNPSKKYIASLSVMERTTCVEAIRRLVRNGLLFESVDPEDRRRRRVELTEKGEGVITRLDKKMLALSHLLTGDLNEEELGTLIPLLRKLHLFHDTLYREKEKEEVIETYGI